MLTYKKASELIKGLSKHYSTRRTSWGTYKVCYKGIDVATVDNCLCYNLATNIYVTEFSKLPFSNKLWMILSELTMTSLKEREEQEREEQDEYNVIIANTGFHTNTVWYKVKHDNFPYDVDTINDDDLVLPEYKFTDKEYKDLIRYIETFLPDGEYQAKIAEYGKREYRDTSKGTNYGYLL